MTIGLLALIAVASLAGNLQHAAESAGAAHDDGVVPAVNSASTFHRPAAPSASLTRYKQLVGVTADPWHVDDWDRAIGARFDIAMNFYAWSKHRNPTEAFAEAARQGVIPMITWEPWRPEPMTVGPYEQGAPQARYSNKAIAAGRWDSYLRMFARAVAAHGGTVFIRYAHEMNGYWYPWHHDATAYVRAWRHVVDLFRQEGAANAVFVWSVNPSLYIDNHTTWLSEIRPYWPGSRYVDWVGSTMINFGGIKEHGVTEYANRIKMLRAFGKPLMLTEVNVHFEGRKPFLRDLRRFLATATWMRAIVWSQFPSRGQASLQETIPIGDMSWQASGDRFSSRVLGAIVREAHRIPLQARTSAPEAHRG